MLVEDNQELHPLEEGELELGKALPWTVYSEAGQLLMREGALVDSQHKLNNLLSKGYRHRDKARSTDLDAGPPPDEPQPAIFSENANPFAELDELGFELKALLQKIEQQDSKPGQVEKQCYSLATQIQGLVDLNADALLGAVHLSSEHPYVIQHPLHVTVMVALIARTLKIPQRIQLSMLAASLTQNIGMYSYQMRLHAQKEPLNQRQKEQVEKHPLEGVKLLSKAGVEDRLWLQVVLQHHEKSDGKGYPKGLKGGRIRPEARIIALADVYSALVSGRPHRPGLSAQQSLKSIFLERGKQFDPKLSMVFLNELGLYPPGASVRLRNGEIALVVKRTSNNKAPRVTSFMDSHGQLFMRMQERDTGDQRYSILGGFNPKNLPRLNPTLVWGIKLKRIN